MTTALKHIPRSELVANEGKLYTVGNNRIVKYQSRVFSGYLHGHEIIQYNAFEDKLCVDDCGYPSSTTRKAINQFFDFFSIPARFSLAKGKCSLYYEGVETFADYGHPITITIKKYGVAA